MGITHVDKILSEERIDCDGILNVTLSVTAQPDVVNNPVDIALVLDRSGSMAGTPMMHLKAGAKEFIDIVMKRTGGRMGRLANGNRIGIVSFAGTASMDVPAKLTIPTTPMRSLRREHCSALPCARKCWSFSPTARRPSGRTRRR